MKWRRGLFRLWIVLSVCWVVAISALTWSTLPTDEWVPGWARNESTDLPNKPPKQETPADLWPGTPVKPQFNPNEPYEVDKSGERMEHIRKAAVLAFVPPTIIVVLGGALAWAIRGFQA